MKKLTAVLDTVKTIAIIAALVAGTALLIEGAEWLHAGLMLS